MSHFTVLVALPPTVTRETLDDRLTAALAPFDENKEVEPYRVYEEGSPEDYWFVTSVRRSRADLLVGAGIKPYEPKTIGWSSASSKETPEQQRAEQARDAEMADRLGEHPTWEHVIAMYVERYPENDDSDRLIFDPATGGAYRMTTYPKGAKWDYWRIGGRWGGYFPVAADARAADVLLPEKSWDSPEKIGPDRCDGGRKRSLDLAGLRAEKAAAAEAEWNAYAALVCGLPEALPWSTFSERVDRSGNGGYSIDDARREYGEQPRVKAARGAEQFRYWFNEDPIQLFSRYDRDEYAARQAARAVPGYATLDAAIDEHWFAPGEMGWFGSSSDDEGSYELYVERANAFVNDLPDDAWLVILDCHI